MAQFPGSPGFMLALPCSMKRD